MKNIAIFSNDLSMGGIQKSLYNLLRNIDYTRYSIDVYLLRDNDFYQDKLPSDVNIYYLRTPLKFLKLVPFFITRRIYKYEGLNKEYDVAIDFDSYQEITSVNAIKCNAKKKVMWIHSDWEKRIKYDLKFKLAHFFSKSKNKHFDEYVGVSEGVVSPFIKVNKLGKINYTVIPNYIDTDEIFEKAEEACSLEVNPSCYNLCTVGSVLYIKGFDVVISDMKKLIDASKRIHLYLIGDGPYMPAIKKKISELGLEPFVTLLGFQKNPYKYMNQMDGFVLESRVEGQGMVFLEAKSLGLDLFMPKHLEKYNTGLYGYDDVVEAIKIAEKKDKVRDCLRAYNDDILEKIEYLFQSYRF